MARESKVERKDKRIIVENVRRVLLKEYLMSETRRACFGGLDIQRTPMGTRVTLLAQRPGLVMGRKGGAIKQPSAEYVAAAAAAQAAAVVVPQTVEALAGVPLEAPPVLEGESAEDVDALAVLEESDTTTKKVKKGKVAAKRLKKVAKEVKELGVDATIDAGGGDEA